MWISERMSGGACMTRYYLNCIEDLMCMQLFSMRIVKLFLQRNVIILLFGGAVDCLPSLVSWTDLPLLFSRLCTLKFRELL